MSSTKYHNMLTEGWCGLPPLEEQQTTPRYPTTSFLTATTLIYAIGAGITAAAGTRLALQLLLAKGFVFGPFQSRIAPVRYFLSLPP